MIRYDDRGVEELAVSVIGQAYKDYIRGRLDWYTVEHRTDSAAAKERFERCVRKKIRERRNFAKWAELSKEEVRQAAEEEVEHDGKAGRATARSCRRFIMGSRYEMFSSRIDAEALLQHAEEMLADWLEGKIQERDLYPSGYGV